MNNIKKKNSKASSDAAMTRKEAASLARALCASSRDLRAAAAGRLGDIARDSGPKFVLSARGAISGIIKCISDNNKDVRTAATYAIQEIVEKGRAAPLVKAGVVPLLVHCLYDREKLVKENAARALKNIAKWGSADKVVEAGAVPLLVKCLSDSSSDVRITSMLALMHIVDGGEFKAVFDEYSLTAIARSLKDENYYVRDNAAGTLGAIAKAGGARTIVEETGALPLLVDRLYDTPICSNAAYAIAHIARAGWAGPVLGAGALPALVGCLGDSDPDAHLNAAMALSAIAKSGWSAMIAYSGAIPLLVRCLSEANNRIHIETDRGIRKETDRDVRINRDIRIETQWALAQLARAGAAKKIVDAGGIPVFLRCIKDKDAEIRMHAILAFSGLAHGGEVESVVKAGAVPLLVECLGNAKTRADAAEALNEIARAGGTKAVIKSGAIPILEKMKNIESKRGNVHIWKLSSGDEKDTTLKEIANEALDGIKLKQFRAAPCINDDPFSKDSGKEDKFEDLSYIR